MLMATNTSRYNHALHRVWINRDMSQLAIEAAVRNVGMAQLLTEIVITAIKKDMIEEILREPSPDPAPQPVPEGP